MIKSKSKVNHLDELCSTFEHMIIHNLKMNPLKYAFGEQVGNFLGFFMHQHGIKVDKNKTKIIIEAQPLQNRWSR
jgi:hypothetical protein